MVVLYMYCFAEIVVANEILDSADVIFQFLREGKRRPDQTGNSLSQRAVESFDMIGYPFLLFDHPMLLCWNHTHISLPAICIEHSMLAVVLGY